MKTFILLSCLAFTAVSVTAPAGAEQKTALGTFKIAAGAVSIFSH